MTILNIMNLLIHAPLKAHKLLRLLLMMQAKQVAQIDQRESYFFHPDYTCIVGGSSRISGMYEGWSAYRDKIILGEVATPAKLLNIITSNDSIKLVTQLTGTRNGKSLDLDVDFIFQFSDNKIIEQKSVPADEQKWSEFWD